MYSHTILVQRFKKQEGRNYFYRVKKFLKQESLVKSNKKKRTGNRRWIKKDMPCICKTMISEIRYISPRIVIIKHKFCSDSHIGESLY